MSTTSDSTILSDNDRLIAALQMCFHELMQKQEDQGERISRALEALKPPARASDKKTAFWDSYLKLADEHDKEFQQKYSTDLDTALIFAGLFSAVGSAFIIQIQPQLMLSHPPKIVVVVQSMLYISLFTTLLAALLAVLGKQWIMSYQAAGSRGTIEQRGLERQRKLDGLVKWKFDALLQIPPLLLQLALLLFATSLSIYLWTVNHSIAIIVMVLTSLGVAAYFFLLLLATLCPDCPFQTPLAPFLIQVISPCLHALRPIFFELQRTIWTFRSSLSRFKSVGIHHLLPHFVSNVLPSTHLRPTPPDPYAGQEFTPASPEVPAVLWVLGTSTDPILISTAAETAIDLQWPLDLDIKSTETVMTRLAEIVHSCFDFRLGGPKVQDNMSQLAIACGRLYCSLRLLARATSIQLDSPLQRRLLLDIYIQTEFDTDDAELENVLHILKESPHLINDGEIFSPSIKWALHIIPSLKSISLQAKVAHLLDHIQEDMPSLDLASFANYLCCLNSLFAPIDPRLMVQMDKTDFRGILMTQLFDAFLDSLLVVDTSVIVRIIDTTAQLTRKMVGPTRTTFHDDCALVREISRFCNTFPRVEGWLDVVVSAAKLFRVDDATDLQEIHSLAAPSILTTSTEDQAADVFWIYTALEHVQQSWQNTKAHAEDFQDWDNKTADDIGSLLKILACSGILPTSPSAESLGIILRALSVSGTDLAFTAFLVLKQGQVWFLDPNLQATMHRSSMLAQLGRVVLDCKQSFPSSEFLRVVRPYIKLMKNLSVRPEWKGLLPITELPTWMTIFSDDVFLGRIKALTSVIRNIWVPKFGEDHQFSYESEECLAFALTALSNVWDIYDFRSTSEEQFLSLVRCTIATTLYSENRWNQQEVTYYSTPGLPPYLMAIFSSRLSKSLLLAAVNARNANYVSTTSQDESVCDLDQMAELLEALAKRLRTEFAPGLPKVQVKGRDRDVWWDLRRNLESRINAFEKSFVCRTC